MLRVLVSLVIGLLVGGIITREYAPRLVPKLAEQGRRLEMLTGENARLRTLVEEAERAKALERSKGQRQEVERAVVAIRGLPFKTPVDYVLLDRKQIKATLAGKLDEVFSGEEFRHMTAGLARMGLLEEGFPLRQKYIDLLGEQVAAFYDQHKHKLVMFEDASLDNAQNRMVLAHELTHALQDQHFGLKRLPLEIKTNDDRAAAASALCEGDATVVMSEYMLKNLSLATIKDTVASSLTQNMDELAKSPRYLREMLVFPYLRGQEFCSAIYGAGGFAAIDLAYAQLPSSTAQILHPEKYVAATRELPRPVIWVDLLTNGQQPTTDNVLGELGIRILFTEWLDATTGETVASGWRGDRYLCFNSGETLVWKSFWATPQQAVAFSEAIRKTFEKRYGQGPKRITRVVSPRESEVVVIDAPTEPWADAVAAQFGK